MDREIGIQAPRHPHLKGNHSLKLRSMRLPRWSLFISFLSSCFYSIGLQRFNATSWLKHIQRANTAFGDLTPDPILIEKPPPGSHSAPCRVSFQPRQRLWLTVLFGLWLRLLRQRFKLPADVFIRRP